MLQDVAVVVGARHDLQLDGAARRADRVPGDDLERAVVVLARLRDVQVPHAVVRQLAAGALRSKWRRLVSFSAVERVRSSDSR